MAQNTPPHKRKTSNDTSIQPRNDSLQEETGAALLGAIITNAGKMILPENINSGMFISKKQGEIWTAIEKLINSGKPPDLLLLKSELKSSGNGIISYLAGITSLPNTYESLIPVYAGKLRKEYRQRQTIDILSEAITTAIDNPDYYDVDELYNKLTATGEQKRESFELRRIGTIEVKPPDWLVKNILEKETFCTLYGDSGAGKSFLALELASCIATGKSFYGFPVKQGNVIYIAGEGYSGISRRLLAWSIAKKTKLNKAPLYLSKGAVSLNDPSTMIPVKKTLKRHITKYGIPALVILDTWARVLGGDDSATADAAAGVAAMDGLRAEFGNFTTLVIHHEGHNKGRARGWSGLRAAVDMEYRAERGADGILRLECTKAKDSKPTEPMAFKFISVELPVRLDSGEFMESAVLNQIEWSPVKIVAENLGKNQKIAIQALSKNGEWVSLTDWQRSTGLSRNRFLEVKHSLEVSGSIEIRENSVRIAGYISASESDRPLKGGRIGLDTDSGIYHTGNPKVSETEI